MTTIYYTHAYQLPTPETFAEIRARQARELFTPERVAEMQRLIAEIKAEDAAQVTA